ncbi:hypothetical protein GCM10020256_17430 [Streptomyces thermocoprophilus]
MDEQMPHVLEASGPREFDGRVLTVVVEALQAADVADLGVGDDDTGKTSRHLDAGGLGPVDGAVDRHALLLELDLTVYG